MLYRLSPVTPECPKNVKMYPPTIAPTIPSTMSRISPSPDLLTILLPIKPAISPRTSHDKIPIVILPLWTGSLHVRSGNWHCADGAPASDRFRPKADSWCYSICLEPARQSKTMPITHGIIHGMAGMPATQPAVVYQLVSATFRSEEHTSELQSRRDLVCRLLLEKKKSKQLKSQR